MPTEKQVRLPPGPPPFLVDVGEQGAHSGQISGAAMWSSEPGRPHQPLVLFPQTQVPRGPQTHHLHAPRLVPGRVPRRATLEERGRGWAVSRPLGAVRTVCRGADRWPSTLPTAQWGRTREARHQGHLCPPVPKASVHWAPAGIPGAPLSQFTSQVPWTGTQGNLGPRGFAQLLRPQTLPFNV